MKSSASPLSRRFVLLLAACLGLLCANTGCGFGHAKTRPASSLSEHDRATLDLYEQIRVALAGDNLAEAKSAAKSLAALLRPSDAKTPPPAALAPAEGIGSAVALDRARQLFKTLSAKIIPLADGVEGYYVMTCALPSAGDWVQQNKDVDNPYLGKSIHTFGELKK